MSTFLAAVTGCPFEVTPIVCMPTAAEFVTREYAAHFFSLSDEIRRDIRRSLCEELGVPMLRLRIDDYYEGAA